MAEQKTFMVEDARIIFRNFSGKEGQYNRAGDCNFAVVLDDEIGKKLLDDGWNVKYPKPRESDEGELVEGSPYLAISVNFNNRPPQIVMITSTGRTHLGEKDIEILDWADIKTCDVIARGYEWDVSGKTGTKAYLQSMYVTIEEDALARKYAVTGDERD